MMAWIDVFETDPNHYTRPYGINNPKTKVLVISAEKEKDDERVKHKTNHTCANPKFIVIDKANLDPPTKLLELIRQHLPTHVFLNFEHKNVLTWNAKEKRYDFSGIKGDITKVMLNAEYLHEDDILDKKNQKNDNYLFLELQNVYRPTEGIYLMTDMTVTEGEWFEKVETLVGNVIPSSAQCSGSHFKILIISGTHGDVEGKTKAVSGFSDKSMLQKKIYNADIERKKELKKKYPHLKIKVKDMEEVNKDWVKKNKPNSNHRKELINFFEKTKPDMVIFDFCYSTNGDICMALRSNAVFSRMLLEADMRSMGIQKAKLNEKQVQILKIAADNDNVKVIALAGGPGSGKTTIGIEIVKIWMSQIMEKYPDAITSEVAENILTANIKELKENLEELRSSPESVYVGTGARPKQTEASAKVSAGAAEGSSEVLKSKMAVYIITDGNTRPLSKWHLSGQKKLAKQLLIDLEAGFFKNMESKNIFFKDIRELTGFGFHEWTDNNYNTFYTEKRTDEEFKTMFHQWIEENVLKNTENAIIMMDEMSFLGFAKRKKYRTDPLNVHTYNVELDFSCLEGYDNVRFVFCLSPTISKSVLEKVGVEYDKTSFPLYFDFKCSDKQSYHRLTARYRNAPEIRNFENFYLRKYSDMRIFHSQLSMDSDDQMNPNQLPDPFSFPIEPKWKDCKAVIWFQDIEKAKKVVRELLSNKYVRFIGPLKLRTEQTEAENTIRQLAKENIDKWEYHEVDNFLGSEADIVVTLFTGEIGLFPVLSRARKLLIIIDWKDRPYPFEHIERMEEAVTKGLVTNGDELVQL